MVSLSQCYHYQYYYHCHYCYISVSDSISIRDPILLLLLSFFFFFKLLFLCFGTSPQRRRRRLVAKWDWRWRRRAALLPKSSSSWPCIVTFSDNLTARIVRPGSDYIGNATAAAWIQNGMEFKTIMIMIWCDVMWSSRLESTLWLANANVFCIAKSIRVFGSALDLSCCLVLTRPDLTWLDRRRALASMPPLHSKPEPPSV